MFDFFLESGVPNDEFVGNCKLQHSLVLDVLGSYVLSSMFYVYLIGVSGYFEQAEFDKLRFYCIVKYIIIIIHVPCNLALGPLKSFLMDEDY